MDHNVVILRSAWRPADLRAVFGEEPVVFCRARDLPGLLKELGVYKSTSEARRAGRTGDIPSGYTELKASKRDFVFIWNPGA